MISHFDRILTCDRQRERWT